MKPARSTDTAGSHHDSCQDDETGQRYPRPARRVVLGAAMVTVSVVGGGIPSLTTMGASSVPPSPDQGSSGVVDELVEVGGARLHLHCSGAGDTTVVLIAGLGDGGDNWGAIEPAVAQSARVCSYAHFGTGTSDPPPGPQTFSTRANDLQTLLRAAGEHSPYLLVGHSFGGAEAVMFASTFPDDVTGVLLLDASPATWITTLCSVVDDGSDAAASYRELCASLSDPANNPEQLDGPSAFAEVAEIESLGDLPMIVDTAAEHPWGLPRARTIASTKSGPLDKTTGCRCLQRHSSCQWTTQDITSRSIDPTSSTYRSLRCWPTAPTVPNPRGRARRSRRRPDPGPAR